MWRRRKSELPALTKIEPFLLAIWANKYLGPNCEVHPQIDHDFSYRGRVVRIDRVILDKIDPDRMVGSHRPFYDPGVTWWIVVATDVQTGEAVNAYVPGPEPMLLPRQLRRAKYAA